LAPASAIVATPILTGRALGGTCVTGAALYTGMAVNGADTTGRVGGTFVATPVAAAGVTVIVGAPTEGVDVATGDGDDAVANRTGCPVAGVAPVFVVLLVVVADDVPVPAAATGNDGNDAKNGVDEKLNRSPPAAGGIALAIGRRICVGKRR
jgi:hypothetical protein